MSVKSTICSYLGYYPDHIPSGYQAGSHARSGSTLLQVMACGLVGTKPINWIEDALLLTGHIWTNFIWIRIKIQNIFWRKSFQNIVCNIHNYCIAIWSTYDTKPHFANFHQNAQNDIDIPNLVSVPHHDVIKWKHFPRCWPFVRGIHRWPVKSPHKGQWRGALMFPSICAWINGWVNNREAGDMRRDRAQYDVIAMLWVQSLI